MLLHFFVCVLGVINLKTGHKKTAKADIVSAFAVLRFLRLNYIFEKRLV